jgi:hypothetical protein
VSSFSSCHPERSEAIGIKEAVSSIIKLPRSAQDVNNQFSGFLKKKRAEARRKGGFKNLSP